MSFVCLCNIELRVSLLGGVQKTAQVSKSFLPRGSHLPGAGQGESRRFRPLQEDALAAELVTFNLFGGGGGLQHQVAL